MPSCAAPGCRSHSRHDTKMHRFPKNPQRREVWAKNTELKLPIKDGLFLCEYHFAADMWEKERVDGKKKLKVHAIPTIFGDAIMQMRNNRASEKSNVGSTQHSPILVYTDPSSKDVVILSQCDETGHHESTEPMQESLLAHLAPSNEKEIPKNTQQENKEVNAQHQETCTNIHVSSKQTLLSEDVPLEGNKCDIINDESVHKQEVELLTAQKEFATSDCNCCMTEKYKKLEKLYLKSEKSRILMKKNHNRLQVIMKRKIMKLEKIIHTYVSSNGLNNRLFNSDQKDFLKIQYKRMPKWCDSTLVKAYQLKFACGTSGYRELLSQGFPLPSLRTLHRNLEKWKFRSGLSTEIFEFLRIKVSQFKKDIDKDCLIVLDEVSISPGKWFDTSTNTYVGNVTLPGHDSNQEATHGLVFMLAGVAQRWKQTVAYFYSGNSTNGSIYKSIILNIIEEANKIGLRVQGIVSDMGAPNQAMWRSFNINVSRYSTVQNKCEHPLNEGRHLFFFHDVCHALKNLKEGILNHVNVTIPAKFVEKYNLPTNTLSSKHFTELINAQKDLQFSLAPKLLEDYLDRSKHFLKMRVKNACNVLSRDVSSALNYLAVEHNREEYKTTVWLVAQIARWFKIVSSRSLTFAISKHDEKKYIETIEFLYEFVDLISLITFGSKTDWKPFQKGIIISTLSCIELSKYLIEEGNYKFVLCGRFTQDCIENLFAVLRSKHCTLNALQLKSNLKLVTISQYMRKISTSNYDEDDREFLPDFLQILRNMKKDCDNETLNKQLSVPGSQS